MMESSVLTGVFLVVLSGLVMGTSPWPLKLMRKFQFEQFAFIAMLVALLILPWTITLMFCPNALKAFASIDGTVLLKSNLFSMFWGIAQVLAMLCFVRIGVSLTYGILCSVGAAVGVITPMVFKGTGLFENAPDLLSSAGLLVLVGVAVMVVGVFFASLAGFGREKLRAVQAEKETQAIALPVGGFAVGLAMVVTAGILSAGWGFAFVYSQGPIIEAMKAQGASDIPAGVAVWAASLFGAALVNVLYPAFLLTKKRSWGVILSAKKEILLSVLYGFFFFLPSPLLGGGMLMLGVLGASVGWGVNQGSLIIGAQGLGFLSGEWRGITGRPRVHIYVAILILIIAMVIMAFGNSLAQS